MKTRLWIVVTAVVAAASAGLHSQQPPTAPASALPSPPQREPAWAFPVQAGALPPESPEPRSVEGFDPELALHPHERSEPWQVEAVKGPWPEHRRSG